MVGFTLPSGAGGGQGPQGPAGPAGITGEYDSKADLAAANIPLALNYVKTAGRLRNKVAYQAADPQQVQSADGAGWKPVSYAVADLSDPEWGVKCDFDQTDDAAALQDVLDDLAYITGTGGFASQQGAMVKFPGFARIDSGLTTIADNLALIGLGGRAASGLRAQVGGITMLKWGNNAGQTYNGLIRDMGFLFAPGVADQNDTICLDLEDWLVGTIANCELQNAHRSLKGTRLNSCHIENNIFRAHNRTDLARGEYHIGLFARPGDFATSGNNSIVGNKNFYNGDPDGTMLYCVLIEAADGLYSSLNHWYGSLVGLLFNGTGLNVGGYVDIDNFRSIGDYYDTCRDACVRLQGQFKFIKDVLFQGSKFRDANYGFQATPDNNGGAMGDPEDFRFIGNAFRKLKKTAITIGDAAGVMKGVKIHDNTFDDNNLEDAAGQGDINIAAQGVSIKDNRFTKGGASGFAVRLTGGSDHGSVSDNDLELSTASQLIVNNAIEANKISIRDNDVPGVPVGELKHLDALDVATVGVNQSTEAHRILLPSNCLARIEYRGTFVPNDGSAATHYAIRLIMSRTGAAAPVNEGVSVLEAKNGADAATAGWGIQVGIDGNNMRFDVLTPGTTNSGDQTGGRWIVEIDAEMIAKV